MNERKFSILVVDDEKSNILALVDILKPEYTVYAARNGQHAIEMAEKHLPDIILLDIIIPEMDGYDVMAALKSSETTKDIPVIFVTGLSGTGDEEKGFALGAADYIIKPFSPALVKLRVAGAMVDIIEKKKMAEMLRRRDVLLSAVNRAASVLLRADDEEKLITSILEGMEIIGNSVDVDCVEVWQNEMKGGELHANLIHFWFSETGRKIKSDFPASSFNYAAVPRWESSLSKGEYVHGPVSGFSKEEQDFLSIFKIKTVLVIPIFIKNNFWGFCCIDDCRTARSFAEDEIDILQSGCYMLANAINRRILAAEQVRMKSRIEAIISNLPGMVYQCVYNSPEWIYTYVSEGSRELIGYAPDELVGKISRYIDMVHPEDREAVQKKNEETIEQGQSYEHNYRLLLKDGTIKWMWERSRVLECDEEGIPVLIEGYCFDITEQKQAEAAELANRTKSAFLAHMSHEMRTPMNVVVGLTDLMLEEDIAENLKENLNKISTAGKTLLRLINDLLDISKIEAGRLELRPVRYDMPSLLNDIISLNIIRTANRPVEFQLDISEDLPHNLYGDDLRLKQIINNLLSNALKFTQKGTVTLGMQIETCEETEKGGEVWMSVYIKDTGIGIRKEDLEKLFTDYAQVDTRTNRMIEGTGLGLSITKRLTELMDGEIWAESEYGEGSVFRIRVKQGYIDDKKIGPTVAENLRKFRYMEDKRIARKMLVRPDLSHIKVLVVDDMQTNLDVAAGLLGRYKMKVDSALDGTQALERIHKSLDERETPYNAIFMDHMMPGMDGVATTVAIRNIDNEYTKKIPIIALTANAVQGMENHFYDHGFQAFLAKPIDTLQLDSIIKKWII